MRPRILVLGAAMVAAALVPAPAVSQSDRGRNLEPFRGLGAWVDIFEDRAWRQPGKVVADLAEHGVRTLYLQTSNYSQDETIVHQAGVARFLDAAHRRGIDVVAWYLPGFANLARDYQRSIAAIRYRSRGGESFDGFGLDIEASILGPPRERTARLLRLSKRLRKQAGERYPLGAIIPSPVGIRLNKGYWPGFPYSGLADVYDAFVPMGYFTYHVDGAEKVHAETVRNVEIIRKKTRDPTVPIHLIGGVADDASPKEVAAFVHAVREHGLIGASLYNWSLTKPHDWPPLETVPANPPQSPPLPLPLPFAAAVGNVPGEDRTHPREVVYRTGPITGPRTLRFEAFDAQADEVEIWVNWKRVGTVPPGTADAWSPPQEVELPDDLLRAGKHNVFAFVADRHDLVFWGVRAVSLETRDVGPAD